jgi:hypothetical protein
MSMGTAPFLKMNGLGNEIIVADMRGRGDRVAPAAAIVLNVDPATKFDQIMAIHDARTPGTAHYVEILNSDGSLAEACGNGMRCVVQALSAETGKKAFVFETLAGIVSAEEHDREMAYVQALTHLIGRTLSAMEIPDESLKTQTYQHLLDMCSLIGNDTFELFTAMQVMNPFAAKVVDGWTGWWSLLRHGKIWLLLLMEFINNGEVSPVLSMAVEAAPSCGAAGAVVCSTSWPVCQSGGPSATPSWRSSLLRRQVVSSPTT